MPEAACGGVKHVMAICGQDTKISKVAQQRDALLLRFKSEDEVSLPCPSLYMVIITVLGDVLAALLTRKAAGHREMGLVVRHAMLFYFKAQLRVLKDLSLSCSLRSGTSSCIDHNRICATWLAAIPTLSWTLMWWALRMILRARPSVRAKVCLSL